MFIVEVSALQKVYTLSAYEISAKDFFERVAAENTDLVLDVRLKNGSQLCGFTKQKDLEFFVPRLTGARYLHELAFAPTKGLLDLYTKKQLDWRRYREEYRILLEQREALPRYFQLYGSLPCVCLLGTETKKRRSHTEVLYDAILHGK